MGLSSRTRAGSAHRLGLSLLTVSLLGGVGCVAGPKVPDTQPVLSASPQSSAKARPMLRHPAAAPDNKVPLQGSEYSIELGSEYSDFNKTGPGKAAGKSAGSDGGSEESSFGRKALLYVPNRVMDLLDIFRVDLGVGPALGGVVRISKWGQAGYREFSPASVRFGLRGRKLPVFVEKDSEFGVSPAFSKSRDRKVTPAEVGLGLDVLLVGIYAGVSLDEAGDFLLGIAGIDLAEDDYE